METLKVELTVRELQTVLQALGNMPYVQVQELIGKLQMQARPQLQGMRGTQESTAPEKDTEKVEKAV